MDEVDGRIVWAPRVERAKIRALYLAEARGVVDEDLLAEVGSALLERCRDILRVTRAHAGEATCARCEGIVTHGRDPDERLACRCGWSVTWAEYLRSYQGRQLHGGGSVPWVEEYASAYAAARGASERMLAIDRLLHRYHWSLRHPAPSPVVIAPSRPTAVNLIEGNMRRVLAFLDELAALGPPGPERAQVRSDFAADRAAADRTWGAGASGSGGTA